jgi:rhodanese-related sulfurtransferase
MNAWRAWIGAVLVLVAAGCRTGQAESLAEVKQAVAENRAVLVDVREQSEWDAGHLAGAKLLPLSQLEADPKPRLELPKDRPIYIYCRSGRRSQIAERILRQQGYQARSLAAGYQELLKAGFPGAGR